MLRSSRWCAVVASPPRLTCMVQPTESWWTEQLAEAEAFDGYSADRAKSWVPPILAALVSAASRTGLVRLYPCRSVNLLRFATSPLWYAGEGHVAPALIALQPNPDGDGVYSGELHGHHHHRDGQGARTNDPDSADKGTHAALRGHRRSTNLPTATGLPGSDEWNPSVRRSIPFHLADLHAAMRWSCAGSHR
jgi:hypothetical protein